MQPRNDSLAARTDTWLQSFLVRVTRPEMTATRYRSVQPFLVWSPGQRDIIKTV
ncbi:hypothetical protein PSY80_24220, partial [Shigella flexneri]|nr:hypothetical protein [Shigella flexneri]